MTSPTDLQDLLGRVEAATGADRELDRAIWWPVSCLPSGLYMEGDDGARYADVCVGLSDTPDWRHLGLYDDAPFYTASLDAALALCERVLPGWTWDIGSECRFDGVMIYTAIVWSADCKRDSGEQTAKTPALALLAAMLKAMVASTAGLPDSP